MKVRTSATPAGKGGRHENYPGAVEDSAGERTGGADGPRLGDRVTYRCPFCDGNANATYKLDRYGSPEWFIGCWKADCDGRHLPSLAEMLELDPAADKDAIVAALRGRGHHTRRREPEPLPTSATVAGWHARLLGPDGREAGRYLARRCVSLREVQRNRIGWNRKALTFPMFDGDGELTGFKTRLPKDDAKMNCPSGKRPWPLYPAVERREGWVLIVGGEFDALAARSAGIPSSSVGLGADYWREEWTEELRGLRVVVALDNDEQRQARERVAALRAAGIDARRLDLRDLGLKTPKGDVSDYLAGGGDPARIHPRRLVTRRVRRSA